MGILPDGLSEGASRPPLQHSGFSTKKMKLHTFNTLFRMNKLIPLFAGHSRWLCLLFFLVFFSACGQNGEQSPQESPLTEEDKLAIMEKVNSLTNAWLAGDKDRIIFHYTWDAVLIPHHGEEQIVGRDAIERYWFNPLYAPPKVHRMDNNVLEVTGAGNYAFVRGRGMLDYEFQNVHYSNTGNFFHVFRRTQNGWEIFRHVWTDPVPQQKQAQ